MTARASGRLSQPAVADAFRLPPASRLPREGVPVVNKKPSTIGELRTAGYKPATVKQEMRKNLIHRIQQGQEHFPGIIGFEDSVVPHLENAIISGQDVIFLGERGQAKSRLIRALTNLLDDEVPCVAGCEINDSPFDP